MGWAAADLRGELSRLVETLLSSDLAIAYNSTVAVLAPGREIVTWAGTHGSVFAPDQLARVAEYRYFATTRQYNCVMKDGALLQITYELHGDEVKAHRLCFYPCPILLDPGYLRPEDDLVEVVDMFLATEIASEVAAPALTPAAENRARLRSPVRFDFDSAATAPRHPACHATFSVHHCRIPVFAPLSLGHFVHFVFMHFYPDDWATHEFLREWPTTFATRTIQEHERRELHLECLTAPDVRR